MMRVIKDDDYKYVYEVQVKYDWIPIWFSIRIGGKDELIEYVQECIAEGKVIRNVVVYETAIN